MIIVNSFLWRTRQFCVWVFIIFSCYIVITWNCEINVEYKKQILLLKENRKSLEDIVDVKHNYTAVKSTPTPSILGSQMILKTKNKLCMNKYQSEKYTLDLNANMWNSYVYFRQKNYFYFSRIISKELFIASLFIIKAIVNPFSATFQL